MASLLELYNLWNHSELQNRITQAGIIVAEEIVNESTGTTNHVNRVKWAVKLLGNPGAEGVILMRYLLAKFNALTSAQLVAAPDTDILQAVRDVVNVLADNS